MLEKVHGRPGRRGAYLLVWGIVYAVIFWIVLSSPDEPTLPFIEMIARWFFGLAAGVAIIAAWIKKLDATAFALLSGSAIFQGFTYLDPRQVLQPDFRFGAFILWVGVGVAQLVVARWPDHPEELHSGVEDE